MKNPIRSLFCGVALMAAFTSPPAIALPNTFHDTAYTATSVSAGASATYTFRFGNHFVDNSLTAVPGANARIVVTFPAGFDLTHAHFDTTTSLIADGPVDLINDGHFAVAGLLAPAANAVLDPVSRTLTISGLNRDVLGTVGSSGTPYTAVKVVISGVKNPATAANQSVLVRFDRYSAGSWSQGAAGTASFNITIPPGVDLAAMPAQPRLYAEEIRANALAPATLLNPVGAQNLRFPLDYNFSSGEVRYVRLECDGGMKFLAGSSASYGGAGSASLGAVNGLGTSAITLSITANDNKVNAGDYLTVNGTRSIVGTSAPVTCTYSLYDFPSQAQAGGSTGRVATVSGPYITFGLSTAFKSESRTSTVDVETSPFYTRLLQSLPTTTTTAALARLTYGLVSTPTPVPLAPSGTPVTLAALHATGPNGTRIVVEGDFSIAGNKDGSFAGAAPSRVYLSTSNGNCAAVGVPAATLSATQASFNVGATATDRMLCLMTRGEVEIPVADYRARLEALPAQPLVYHSTTSEPVAAGSIVHDDTRLQAPLVQVAEGWTSRIALTNTASVPRKFFIRVLAEDGVLLGTANHEGTIPARGTTVIDLADVLRGPSASRRGTLIVTVNGKSKEVQGLYQIVNPAAGTISNHVMVRPGTN